MRLFMFKSFPLFYGDFSDCFSSSDKNRYDKEIEILSIVIYFILMAVAVDFKE